MKDNKEIKKALRKAKSPKDKAIEAVIITSGAIAVCLLVAWCVLHCIVVTKYANVPASEVPFWVWQFFYHGGK